MKHLKSYESLEDEDKKRIDDYLVGGKRILTPEEVYFFKCIRERKNKEVKDLIASGININKQDGNGYTPLMVAADQGNLIIVIELIKAGADWSIESLYGRDFIDNLNYMHREMIMNRFPEQWKKRMDEKEFKNNVNKYNV